MNKAFKVLWNQVRNTYVVASEAQTTHGKPAKATKTIVAAAVAGLMAVGGTAFAKDITYEYLTQEEGTSKFVSGNGEELVIKTEGDAKQLAVAIKSGDLTKIREALGVSGGKATLVGLAGGQHFYDHQTNGSLMTAGAALRIAGGYDELEAVISKLQDQFSSASQEVQNIVGDTKISIGGGCNPLLLGTIGGDNLLNLSLSLSQGAVGADPIFTGDDLIRNIVREGNVVVDSQSGNLIGLIGGSSAINVGGVTLFKGNVDAGFLGTKDIYVKAHGTDTSTTIKGNTNIGLNGSTSSVGVFGAGSAIAITGKASSTVTGSSNIKIDTTASSAGYEGLHAGVVGGGLSLATMGGESTSAVGATTIDLTSGAVLGVLGGGVAASAEISVVTDKLFKDTLKDYKDNILFDESLEEGGTASATSGDIHIIVGEKSSVAGIVGGGLAAAQQMWDSTKSSTADVEVDNIQIDIGSTEAAPMFSSEEEKLAYHKDTVSPLLDEVKKYIAGDPESIGEFKLLGEIVDAAKPGLTIGVLGGGMALGYQANNGASADKITNTAKATSTVKGDIAINVHSGYNIGIFGSGLAASSAASVGEETQNAVSTVNDVLITLDGGDTVGVMGGGITFFTGTGEPNKGVSAESTTASATIHVTDDAVVDGLVGGGLAIDDSNPKGEDGQYIATKNASSTVETANILVDSGNVGYIHFEVFNPEQAESNPGLATYWNSLTYAMLNEKAAIVGGGLASGGQGAENDETGAAHVGTVNIVLNVQTSAENGATTVVDGNIFGGGIATDGAWSSVATSNISVDGAVVNGDIYGGGLALEGKYMSNGEKDTYNNQSKSTVDTVNIYLASGEVNGNVYAGGKVSSDSGEGVASSTVQTANVYLSNDQVLGTDSQVDGSGAQTANLFLSTQEDAYTFADGQSVTAFDTITSATTVSGMNYNFGDKNSTTVLGGPVDFASLDGISGKTLAIGNDQSSGIASYTGSVNGLTLDIQNGLMSINTDSKTGMAGLATVSTQPKAALFVTGSTDLSGAKVWVGNAEKTELTGLFLGSDGMLIADAATRNTAVTADRIDTSAGKIHFVGVATEGAKVTIAASEGTATSVDNVLYKEVRNDNVYTFEQRSSSELDEVGLGDVDDTDALGDISSQDDDASEYIKGFLDQSNTSIDNTNRSQQINAAMNLAAAAGVQTVAIDSAAMGIDAAAKRASLINDFAEGGVLFAEATGKRFEMGGSSDFGAIKADLGGIVVGGEYTTNDWTFGALANLGTGTVRGQDTNSGVKNDVDYYGVQAYAAKRFGSFNVVGQVGYVTTSNDVSHATAALDKADIDADVMSVSVRGEMRFDLTQNTRLVPYVGVNYLRVSTDGFHTKQGLEVKDQDQDIVTIPVGVKFAGDMQTASGWKWTPSMDIGYVAALGDRDTDARTKVGATTVHTSMDVWSESVVRTSFGLKAQKENWGFGVQAGSALGSDDTQELFGQVRVDYRF